MLKIGHRDAPSDNFEKVRFQRYDEMSRFVHERSGFIRSTQDASQFTYPFRIRYLQYLAPNDAYCFRDFIAVSRANLDRLEWCKKQAESLFVGVRIGSMSSAVTTT